MPASDLYTFDSYDTDDKTTPSISLVAVSPKMYLHNSTPPSSTATPLGDGASSPQMAMYGDEASLYSIAEDSREGRASEFTTPSAAGGAAAAAYDFSSNNNEYGEEDNDFGIEMTLDDDDGSATRFYNYEQRRRRRRLLVASAFLICLLFAIVAVTITVSLKDEDSSSRSVVSEGLVDGEDGGGGGGEIIPPPTPAPTFEDTTRQQAETLVVLALDGCPGDRTGLLDATTPQNQVFEALVDEVVSQASFDARTGIVTWDERHAGGVEYLREKFALDMLYQATVGDSWTVHEQWMGPTDPCDGWTGVVCGDEVEAVPRVGGTCAVTSLELGKFVLLLLLLFSRMDRMGGTIVCRQMALREFPCANCR